MEKVEKENNKLESIGGGNALSKNQLDEFNYLIKKNVFKYREIKEEDKDIRTLIELKHFEYSYNTINCLLFNTLNIQNENYIEERLKIFSRELNSIITATSKSLIYEVKVKVNKNKINDILNKYPKCNLNIKSRDTTDIILYEYTPIKKEVIDYNECSDWITNKIFYNSFKLLYNLLWNFIDIIRHDLLDEEDILEIFEGYYHNFNVLINSGYKFVFKIKSVIGLNKTKDILHTHGIHIWDNYLLYE